MIAYRDLMFTLILLFSFLTIVLSPAFVYFKKYDAIQLKKPYVQYSLGNMGYSSSQCSIMPLGGGTEDAYVYIPI